MSPISKFGVLALASAVLAVPHHRHLHPRQDRAVNGGAIRGPDVPTPDVPTPDVPATSGVPTPDVPDAAGAASGAIGGKRGIDYNDASQAAPYAASPIFGWAANWISNSAGLSNAVSYIPTLHNGDSTFTSSWASDAQAAIDSGSQYLFGFNEPDIASQANLDPVKAAALWKQHMEPFKDKAKLVAPAVSNSETPGLGLDWLKAFMQACSGCTFHAMNQHWYAGAGDVDYFKQKVEQAHSQTGLPVFVGEFGATGDDNQISEFLNQVMGWMDANDSVLGYAYFMAAEGYLNQGGKPAGYGLTYLNN